MGFDKEETSLIGSLLVGNSGCFFLSSSLLFDSFIEPKIIVLKNFEFGPNKLLTDIVFTLTLVKVKLV